MASARRDRSSTRSSSARVTRASARGTSVRSSRASSATRRQRAGSRSRAMIERLTFGTVPRKHHIQLRLPDGKLAFEECFTQQGFEGPYTIAYHQRAPHTQRLSDAKHGWTLPVDAAEGRRLAKRHYKTQDMKRTGGAPVDAR